MSLKSKLKEGRKILTNMQKDNIDASSAQCAYYVILSFVPVVILLLTLVQYTSIKPEELFDILNQVMPTYMSDMVVGIVREVYSKSIGTISLSLIFILLSADRGLFALTKELHIVYNYSENKKKSFIHLKLMSILKTIIFIIVLAIGVIILVFGKPILSTIQESFGILKNFTILTDIITYIVTYIVINTVTFIVFLSIYKFIPEQKVTFKSQIKGAIVGSVLLNVVSFVFSRYLDIFKGFSLTYGSLTALILIMMWTYACFYIIFIGAEINKYYELESIKKKTPKMLSN